MKESLKIFTGDLKNAFKDLFPIIVVVDNKDEETAEILSDIAMLSKTLDDAKSGLGKRTGKHVIIDVS